MTSDALTMTGDASVVRRDGAISDVAEPVHDSDVRDAPSSGSSCGAQALVRFVPGGDEAVQGVWLATLPTGFVTLYESRDGRPYGGLLTPMFADVSPRTEAAPEDRMPRQTGLVAGGDGRVGYCGHTSAAGDGTVRFLDSRGAPAGSVPLTGSCLDLTYAGGEWLLLSRRPGNLYVQPYDAGGGLGPPITLSDLGSESAFIFAWDDVAVVLSGAGGSPDFFARSIELSSGEVGPLVSLGARLPIHTVVEGDRAYIVSGALTRSDATMWLVLDRSLEIRERLLVPEPIGEIDFPFPFRVAMLGDRPVAGVMRAWGEVELQILDRDAGSVERIPVPMVWPSAGEEGAAGHSFDLAVSGGVVVVAVTHSEWEEPAETWIWSAECL